MNAMGKRIAAPSVIGTNCDHGPAMLMAVKGEVQPQYEETSLGLPVVLMNAVEIKRCPNCGEILSVKIPDLQNLIAAMGVMRVGNPLKLAAMDIKFLRKALNITARELADRLEVSPETISRWENGKDVIGPANEKLLRLIVGDALTSDAPAIDFDPDAIINMRVEIARSADGEDRAPMCFERIRFKRPAHPKEDQWDAAA